MFKPSTSLLFSLVNVFLIVTLTSLRCCANGDNADGEMDSNMKQYQITVMERSVELVCKFKYETISNNSNGKKC